MIVNLGENMDMEFSQVVTRNNQLWYGLDMHGRWWVCIKGEWSLMSYNEVVLLKPYKLVEDDVDSDDDD